MKKSIPKQIAEENGDIIYEGTPCKREGHTLRYTKSGQCVECDKEWIHPRSDGKRLIFEGTPCSYGHTLRYTVRGQCVQCEKDRVREKMKTTKGRKERSRNRLKIQYGMTEFDWLIMYEQQGGKCLMSNCTVTSHDKWWEQGNKGLCVDHCHKTGKIRGLLCSECNRKVGILEKNIRLAHDQIKHIYNFMS